MKPAAQRPFGHCRIDADESLLIHVSELSGPVCHVNGTNCPFAQFNLLPMARKKWKQASPLWGAVTLMLLGNLFAPAASALTDEDWNECARSGGLSIDLPIRGCTAVIEAGQEVIAKLAAAYNNRALAFRSNGDVDRAIADYNEAIRLKPDYFVAINNRGVAFLSKGDLDRAIADLDRTIELKPDHLLAYHARAIAFERKGQYERAIADYDRIIKADPRNPALLRARGTVKGKLGDHAGANADFRLAESTGPGRSQPASRPR